FPHPAATQLHPYPLHLTRSHLPSPLRITSFLLNCYRHHRHLHSFPTRRSSDLIDGSGDRIRLLVFIATSVPLAWILAKLRSTQQDRKSTRLNSSHRTISYAVFCLKKKKCYSESGETCRSGRRNVENSPATAHQC